MWWRYLVFLVLPLVMAIIAGMAIRRKRDLYIFVSIGAVPFFAIPTYVLADPRPGSTWWAELFVGSWLIGILVLISAISHWIWWTLRLRKRDEEGNSLRC